MFVILYQLILFGIRPIRKRILHWLEVAAEATDSKPHLINSLLYLGVTCLAPLIWLLVMNVLLKFISNDNIANVAKWDAYMVYINGALHFVIFVIRTLHIDIRSPFDHNN